jgi:DNA-directed RNA polymerase sigma subunit (sigma70/sigma32)
VKLFKDCGLTPIEECITKMRCGIECEPHISEQIAAELGIQRERIRQIESRALRKLRHGLEMKKSAAAQGSNFPPNDGGDREGTGNGNPSGTHRTI